MRKVYEGDIHQQKRGRDHPKVKEVCQRAWSEWQWWQLTALELDIGLQMEGRGDLAVVTSTGGGSRESCLETMDVVCSRDNEGVNCSKSMESRKRGN